MKSIIIWTAAFVTLAALAFAGVPQTINYQGYLKNGTVPASGPTNMTFSLYSTTNGAGAVWSGSKSVDPVNGIYSIELGATPQPALPAFDRQYWLGVQAKTEPEMRPLQPLSSAPYALRADVANSLATGATVPGATPWVSTTSTTFQATTNSAYLLNNSTPTTITLPGNAAVGDVIKVNAQGAGGYTFSTTNGQTISGAGIAADYNVWLPRAGSKMWRTLAMSADGTKVVAAAYGDNIRRSTDGGLTWGISGDSTIQNWQAIASSSDGSKLVAVVNGGQVYTSSDSGGTWVMREMNTSEGPIARAWHAVISSVDGSKLIAASNGAGGQLWASVDFGASWALLGITGNWKSIAASADGSKLVAAVSGGLIWLSGDGGSNWASIGTTNTWTAVATSADGTKNLASDNSLLYTFDDKRGNWKALPPITGSTPLQTWDSLASSADGSVLAANGIIGPFFSPQAAVYLSTDGGLSWVLRYSFFIDPIGNPIKNLNVALSADGTKVAATQNDSDFIYFSGKTVYSGNQFTSTELVYAGSGQWVLNNPAAIGQGNIQSGNNALVTGTFNAAYGTNSVVSGGYENVASASNATIAGGSTNTAGSGATVSGGINNSASGPSSIIGGGIGNTSSGSYSTVAGGQSNTAPGSYSAIGGGISNSAGGSYSIVAGGSSNNASGLGAVIFGGTSNIASGWRSVITGGLYNTASGNTSTILGGDSNTASGPYSTVVGGVVNTASDWYSLAAGCSAIAANRGTFVWSDSQCTNFSSTAQDQFLIKATGGVGINKNNPVAGTLDVAGNALVSGNLGIGTLAPNRRLHLAQNGGTEMSLLVIDGLANWRTWNIWAGGTTTGAAQNLIIRMLDDTGSYSVRDSLILNNNGNVTVAGNNNWDLTGTEGDFRIGNSTYRLKIGVPTGGGGAGDISIKADGGLSRLNLLADGGIITKSNTTNPGMQSINTTGIGLMGSTGNNISVYGVNTSTDAPSIEGWNQGTGDIFRGWSGASGSHTLKFRVLNNGNIIANTVTYTSDLRLKTDIQPLENTLAKVLNLRGVSYVMKTDETKERKIGVIAQELEQEYPELVATDEKGMKSVAYANLTAILIEAVKGLKTENDVLRAELAEIRNLLITNKQ